MGCDMHVYVEKKKKGKWMSAQGLMKTEEGEMDVPYPDKVYNGRNYELFGFLTEGKVRSDPQIYAGKLKGFPKDASPEIKKIFESWESDGHTPNYFTLEELEKIDWDNLTIPESGLMEKKQWTKFNKSMKLKNQEWSLRFPYCEMTTQAGHEQHEWKVPIKVAFGDFYERVVRMLSYYDWKCKKHEVRIVFWFDN